MMPSGHSLALALAVAGIPTYLLRFSILGIPTNFFEILVMGALITGLLMPAVRQEWRAAEQTLSRPVVVLVGLFVLAALLSAIVSDVPRVSFGIFKSWVIVPLLLAWLVYVESRMKNIEFRIFNKKIIIDSKFLILNSLVLSGVIVALVSISQFEWGQRLSGIYDVPNSLALYLAPITVLALWPVLSNFQTQLYSLGATIMFFALLLTQSVAGISAVLIVLIAALTLRFYTFPHFEMWKGLIVPLSSIIACGVVAALYLHNTDRLAYLASPLTTNTPNSLAVRGQLWDISLDLIREHPLLGIGLGQFEPAYQQKLHERFANIEVRMQNVETHLLPLREFVYRDSHNWILSFWLNTGLLGLLSFAGIHVYVLRLAWQKQKILQEETRNQKLETSRSHLLTSSFYILPLATLLLMGLVDTIYWKNDLSALHWIFVALILRSPAVKLDGHQAKGSES